MIRFDTIDTKPKLYSIINATIVMVAFLIIFIIGKQDLAICLLLLAYMLVVMFLLGRAFIRQLQYNPYSYNTIYYAGFFMFVFFVFLTQLLIFMMISHNIGNYTYLDVINTILNSARNFMLLTFPLIFIFSLGLVISNISLIRHEGFGLTIAEARILNKPVVCTNFEACTMQMVDGKNGLITSFEPKDIADAIEKLLTDKHLYEEIEAYLKQEKKGNVEEIENFYQLIGC